MSAKDATWADLDRYITRLFASEDAALKQAVEDARRSHLPEIHVSASEGKILFLLARMIAARRIIELGTLGGYSTIWLGRALPPEGRLISLELELHHAQVAAANITRAGLAGKVEIRTGPAAESLKQLSAAEEPPFDLVFIDADKDNYPLYLDLVLPLTRPGGLILADNALSHNALDPNLQSGISRYNQAVSQRPELTSIILPVLRDDVIDGLLVSIKS
jgi:predicted O-methyltransferase YrrM